MHETYDYSWEENRENFGDRVYVTVVEPKIIESNIPLSK
jgi:hypothetical protein